MERSFYYRRGHRTRHVQVDNWRWKRSQQYMAHQPAKKILCMKAIRHQCSWSIKMVFLDNICIIMTHQCSWSIKMVSQQHMTYYGYPRVVSKKQNGWKYAWAYRPRVKELKRCLSPPMRVANKLTPEPKSKMAKNMPEHTGREQKSW